MYTEKNPKIDPKPVPNPIVNLVDPIKLDTKEQNLPHSAWLALDSEITEVEKDKLIAKLLEFISQTAFPSRFKNAIEAYRYFGIMSDAQITRTNKFADDLKAAKEAAAEPIAWVSDADLRVSPNTTDSRAIYEVPEIPGAEAPVLSSLSPTTAALGSADFTLHVTGTGFVSADQINWNGTNEPTTYVSATELTTQVNMATAVVAAEIPVKVRNSNVLTFSLTAAAGTLGAQSGKK